MVLERHRVPGTRSTSRSWTYVRPLIPNCMDYEPNMLVPSYEYEYSAREAYGQNITWAAGLPLNATWWHRVTERSSMSPFVLHEFFTDFLPHFAQTEMQRQPSLISAFHARQGRLSTFSGNCTSALCLEAKVCLIRAGTAAQGLACPSGRGFASVQSK